MIDGINDEGHGDAVIYYRVDRSKARAVESTLLPQFLERLNCPDHRQRWYMIGHGEPCVRWLRSSGILNVQNKVPIAKRRRVSDIMQLRRKVREYVARERHIVYEYDLKDFGRRYNGGGFRGTGGPKVDWLRFAVNEYLHEHYPELQVTMLTQFFSTKEGWRLVFAYRAVLG